MKFRYDFGQKIDLTKFRKQALHYIKAHSENKWEFHISIYRVFFASVHRGNKMYRFELELQEFEKDNNGDISKCINVRPGLDTKFNEVKCFHVFYDPNNKYQIVGSTNSLDIELIIDSLIYILKYISKVENLKAFL